MDYDLTPYGVSTKMELLKFVIIQVVFIALAAFFSASETAVISLDDTKLRRQAADGDKISARLLKMLNDGVVTSEDGSVKSTTSRGLSRNDFLLTVRICITITSMACAAATVSGAAEELAALITGAGFTLISTETISHIGKIVIILFLVFFMTVFGQIVPQRQAMGNADKFARFSCPLLSFFEFILRPMIFFVSRISNLILKPDKSKTDATTALSEDEIRYLLIAGEKKGTIDSDEREMIDNIFEFNDRTASEIMTHRTDMVVIWEDDSEEEIIEKIRVSGYSRFPVCGESIDEIKGIVRTREYLLNLRSDEPKTLEELLAKPFFVPETAKADSLFSKMQQQKTHMAFVIDEYGGISGLITMEDLLEEIVGNIYDETDTKDEQHITKLSDDSWRIAGNTSLEEVSDALGIDIGSDNEDFGTLGGLIFSCLEQIPPDGTHPVVTVDGLTIRIDEITDRRVTWATVKKLPVDNDKKSKEEESGNAEINLMAGV
jgi:putative hemolysin